MVGVLRRGLSVLLLSLGVLGGLLHVPVGYAARLPQVGVSPLSSPGTGINVAGPAAGGGVWFTGGEVVGRVNDRGQVLAQSVSLANDPCAGGELDGLPNQGTVDRERHFWFLTSGSAVGSADPGGSPIVRACSPFVGGLGSMAVGADGDVWFTQASGIARLAPATGRVTMPIRSGRVGIAYPQGVSVARDGSVWFGESGGPALNLPVGVGGSLPSYLGRWRNGRVTALSVRIPGERWSGPIDVVMGRDGRIWFATHFGIGASTVAGRIVFHRLNHERGRAAYPHWVNGLTAAPDGNIWFTQEPDLVGRMTPAGQVTRWHTSAPHPQDIAPGSGLSVWITEPNTGVEDPYSLVRLTIPATTCQVPVLRRLSLAGARRLAALAHCRLGRVHASRRARRGRLVVVSQRPVARTVRRLGQRIDVTLGAAPRRRSH